MGSSWITLLLWEGFPFSYSQLGIIGLTTLNQNRILRSLLREIFTDMVRDLVDPSLVVGPIYELRSIILKSFSDIISAAVQKEVLPKQYFFTHASSVEDHSLLGWRDMDNSGFDKVRLIHNLSVPSSTSCDNQLDGDDFVSAFVEDLLDLNLGSFESGLY